MQNSTFTLNPRASDTDTDRMSLLCISKILKQEFLHIFHRKLYNLGKTKITPIKNQHKVCWTTMLRQNSFCGPRQSLDRFSSQTLLEGLNTSLPKDITSSNDGTHSLRTHKQVCVALSDCCVCTDPNSNPSVSEWVCCVFLYSDAMEKKSEGVSAYISHNITPSDVCEDLR